MAARKKGAKNGKNQGGSSAPKSHRSEESSSDSEHEMLVATDAAEVATPNMGSGDSDSTSPSRLMQNIPSLSRIMSVVVLVLGILGVGLLFYRVMAGFFVPLFLAALLVVIFRPVHEWIYFRLKGKRRVAAAITTSLILMIVLMPILFLLSIAAGQFASAIKQIDSGSLKNAFKRSREQLGLSIVHPEYFRRLDEIVDSMQSTQLSQLDSSDLLQAVDIIGSLQNDPDFSEAKKIAALPQGRDAVESLNKLIQELTQWQTNSVDPLGQGASLESLEVQEQLTTDAELSATKIRAWMLKFLGGSMWEPLKLAANLSDTQIDGLIKSARETMQPRFVQLTSRTGGFLVTLGVGTLILVISVYFFLIDGPGMVRTLMRLSPLDDNYERRLLLEFDRTSRAVVLASVLSALAQGVLAAVAFYFLGFESVVLLFFATTVMALVPFLGAASVWVPCAIWLGAVEREWGAAIFLAIYGALVVSSIDNVIKVFVLHGRSQLHPLLALLSVLGGVTVFGPIGILVGPMVVVFLQTLLEILNHELDPNSEHSAKHSGLAESVES